MKILKRSAYIILAIPVAIVWFIHVLASPGYWIITGSEEMLANKFAGQSIRLSKYLRS